MRPIGIERGMHEVLGEILKCTLAISIPEGAIKSQ